MNLLGFFRREGPSEVLNATARLEQHARDLQEVIRLARIELIRQQRPKGDQGDTQR